MVNSPVSAGANMLVNRKKICLWYQRWKNRCLKASSRPCEPGESEEQVQAQIDYVRNIAL